MATSKPTPRPAEDTDWTQRTPASVLRARQKQQYEAEQAALTPKPKRPPMGKVRGHSLPNAGRADLY